MAEAISPAQLGSLLGDLALSFSKPDFTASWEHIADELNISPEARKGLTLEVLSFVVFVVQTATEVALKEQPKLTAVTDGFYDSLRQRFTDPRVSKQEGVNPEERWQALRQFANLRHNQYLAAAMSGDAKRLAQVLWGNITGAGEKMECKPGLPEFTAGVFNVMFNSTKQLLGKYQVA